MTTAYLASTALMGLFAVAVVVWMARGHGWYRYTPTSPSDGGSSAAGRGDRLADRPMTWVVAFTVLVVGFVGGVVAAISGSTESQAVAGLAVAIAGGTVLVGYLLFGVYLSATRRGHPRSLAVAESATVAGLLFLVAITVQLLG